MGERMTLKRIIGILICIGGIALLFISNYIEKEVAAGKQEISSAEQKVGQGKTLFGLNPYTKEIGNKAIFDPAEKKIQAGKAEVAYYEALASRLRIGGIAAIVIGIAIVLIPFGAAKKRN